MPDVNPGLPIVGQPNSTEEAKVVNCLSVLIGAVNNPDSANLTPTAGILDTQLASPGVSATWKTLAQMPISIGAGTGSAATYFLNDLSASIGALSTTGGGSGGIYLDPADFALTGPPGVSFTFGLHGVAVSNISGAVSLTSTGAIAGSTVGIGTPPGNTKQTNTSSTFNFPAADVYAFCVALTGTTAASSSLQGRLLLQLSHA